MARIMELHGEIAGLTAGSGGYKVPEYITSSTGMEVMDSGDFTTPGAGPRKDSNGNGGNFAFGNNNSSTNADMSTVFGMDPTKVSSKTIVECFYRIPYQKSHSTSTLLVNFKESFTGKTQAYVGVGSTGTAYIGSNGVTRATLAGACPTAPGTYHVLTVWLKIDQTSGWIRVYKDFDYSTPILEWEGIVYDNFPSGAAVYHDVTEWNVDKLDSSIDDVVCNDVTMTVTPTAGAFSAGTLITGTDTGATATITRVDAIPGSSDVQLQLTGLVTGGAADWDGLQSADPFATETEVAFGANTGTPINSGLDPNSGLPGNSYFAPAQQPTGQGNVTTLDSLPVLAAADQWENVAYDGIGGTTYLGLGPDAEVSYNYDGTGGLESLYTVQAHGVPSADIGSILGVRTFAWARKDGTGIDDIEMSLRSGTTSTYAEPQGLGASFDVHTQAWPIDPDTTIAWTPAGVDAIEIGARF